jgi:hypothetical protein
MLTTFMAASIAAMCMGRSLAGDTTFEKTPSENLNLKTDMPFEGYVSVVGGIAPESCTGVVAVLRQLQADDALAFKAVWGSEKESDAQCTDGSACYEYASVGGDHGLQRQTRYVVCALRVLGRGMSCVRGSVCLCLSVTWCAMYVCQSVCVYAYNT